jgi:galactokinase
VRLRIFTALFACFHAMLLKCNIDYEYVPLKIDGCKLVVTHTNKRRGLTDSKYNERRKEYEEGL